MTEAITLASLFPGQHSFFWTAPMLLYLMSW